MSRISGGIGGRGPGETKLEISRRRARDKITLLEKQLREIGSERALRRKRRSESGVPVVALVGYTNVGKTTLFNALTQSQAFAYDKLFATLEPTTRTVSWRTNDETGERQEIVFADTVGFIRELPDELKSAFRATLEEVLEADLVLHVVDSSDPAIEHRVEAVRGVLEELEATKIPQIVVLNKIDKITARQLATVQELFEGEIVITISAKDRTGFAELRNLITDTLQE
jgi:GTP-binding protein HflX